ncbi:MAG: extracellular solute-binding protein [Ignavibacteria bacterium]|nr:extracellular solute-binding protein [Ignavibacteria bacterium]
MNSFLKTSLSKNILILISLTFFNWSCVKEEVKIRFWHFWSEPKQAKVIKEIVAEFEKIHKCKVEISELSWNDGKTKLILAFNSRTAPDVIELGSDWVSQFSSAQVLEELSETEFQTGKYFNYSLEPGKYKNKIYAIPWIVATRVLFCNLELMEKSGIPTPPKTLDELLFFSSKINDDGFGYGFGANGTDPHRLYKKILPLIWTFGGEIVDSNGNIVINNYYTIKSFDYYFKLSRTGIIETQKQIDLLFVQGKVAFCFSGEWLLDLITQSNADLHFTTSLIPGVDGKPGISFAGGEYLAINKNSKNKELAKTFIKFLLSDKNVIKLCREIPSAGFPADTLNFKNPELIINNHKKTFAEQLKYSKMTPVHPRWIEIEAIIEKALEEVIYQKKDIQEALKDAQKEIDIYNRNISF